MKFRTNLLFGFAALPVALAACGSSSSSSPSSNASATTAKASSKYDCTRATASAVSAALGVQAGDPTPDTSNTDNGVVVCDYPVGSNPQAVKIRFETKTNKQSFDTAKQSFATEGEATSDIAGLGDEAYSSTLPATPYSEAVNTVVVLKSDVSIELVSTASIDKATAYARQLIA